MCWVKVWYWNYVVFIPEVNFYTVIEGFLEMKQLVNLMPFWNLWSNVNDGNLISLPQVSMVYDVSAVLIIVALVKHVRFHLNEFKSIIWVPSLIVYDYILGAQL